MVVFDNVLPIDFFMTYSKYVVEALWYRPVPISIWYLYEDYGSSLVLSLVFTSDCRKITVPCGKMAQSTGICFKMKQKITL